MLDVIPTDAQLLTLVGDVAFDTVNTLRAFLAAHYTLDAVWDKGGKAALYQCRYRRAGKTLCTLLFKPGQAACMMVFGAAERAKAEALSLSPAAREAYQTATTYHDGKWVWFTLDGAAILRDLQALLPVKRRFMK